MYLNKLNYLSCWNKEECYIFTIKIIHLKKAYFNWSTGKDSALALHKILQNRDYTIGTLVTTVNQKFKRVSMHGVPEILLDEQANQIGLPLYKIYFPEDVSMETYSDIMKSNLKEIVANGNYKFSVF